MAEHHMQFKTNAGIELRVKEEEDCYPSASHSHTLNVKFKLSDSKKYTINCHQPCTVLEALKSSKKYDALKCTDENIVIQLGKADKEFTVATHFPCSCIVNRESLIISHEQEKVEESKSHNQGIIHPRSKYSVFYIDTVGGKYTKTKKFLRNNNIKIFRYLCVYGEKGTTVEDVLKRDGRFIDNLGDFTLSDNENPNVLTEHIQLVDNLDQKKFKLCLPQKKKTRRRKSQRELTRVSEKSQNIYTAVAQHRESSAKAAMEKKNSLLSMSSEELYEKLRQQFPELKKWMESRFPGDSYQKAVNLQKENFGKIQQSFSKVHTVRNLLKLGESVCQIQIKCSSGEGIVGTGFVVFDNYVMTNAHLFEPFAQLQFANWQENIEITAKFNYEGDDCKSNTFNARIFHLTDVYLDYAILVLDTGKTKETEIPPGLLEKFGPLSQSGGACIIGHPKGEVKQMDLTCVIEKENRGQAVNSNLEGYTDDLQVLCSINNAIKNYPFANHVVTYNTFMFHGSSGSPVFNTDNQVFALHSAGFFYKDLKPNESVIEFAYPLLSIFRHFVSELKNEHEELLERVREKAKGNSHLENILNETEPMQIG